MSLVTVISVVRRAPPSKYPKAEVESPHDGVNALPHCAA